jgi:SAM-dependent methyltransferase
MSSSALIEEARATARSGSALLFLPTVFLGALLLFAIEPMIAKMIVPWFGGAAEVWIVCLLFFQMALLAGYLYAHLLRRWVAPGWQRVIHLGLLALSLGALPVVPSAAWKPVGDEAPLWLILGLLTATIGAPYVLLAATSPLMQSWWAQRNGATASPYRLFALSNTGSLLALLAYPVAVEPFLATGTQARLWSVLYLSFVAICGATAWLTRDLRGAPSRPSAGATSIVIGRDRLLWFALSTSGSALLMAITTHLGQNVAAIPLLWVLPLTLYLLSFILCFDSDRWYRRGLFYILFAELVPAMVYAAGGHHANSGLYILLPLFLAGLFVVCMVCHGELAAMRPGSDRLTGYYLTIAAGGAAGGIFVGAVAPAIFPALYELPLMLCLTAALAFTIACRRARPFDRQGRAVAAIIGIAWLATAGLAVAQAMADARGAVVQVRNFYGALQVVDLPVRGSAPAARRLMHGTIEHGEQLADPARAMVPTTYYSRGSGVGLAIAALQRRGPVRVGVIGLGAGTLAAYGRAGDRFRFYEIDPQVADIARRDFSFLTRSPARTDIVLGDGRLRLEAEPAQMFDLLVVDAFSGDAIPVHLLTAEAFALYARHLAPGGVIAVHVSNQYLDLLPVVAAGAACLDMVARHVANGGDTARAINPADWVLVAKPAFFADPAFAAATVVAAPDKAAAWTDDYSNLWRRLK